MFAQNTVSLTARRRESMDAILQNATQTLAQKVTDGLITREDAEKVHVYAIAALASGMPGASSEKGAADERRQIVSDYLTAMVEGEETDAA
jgi:hypothetical protein